MRNLIFYPLLLTLSLNAFAAESEFDQLEADFQEHTEYFNIKPKEAVSEMAQKKQRISDRPKQEFVDLEAEYFDKVDTKMSGNKKKPRTR